jgi:AraC-like DNA-binding protein
VMGYQVARRGGGALASSGVDVHEAQVRFAQGGEAQQVTDEAQRKDVATGSDDDDFRHGLTLSLLFVECFRQITPRFRKPKVMMEPLAVPESPSVLRCWHGSGFAMSEAHRHDDIEVNIVEAESLTYLFGGSLVQIEPGQAAVFWAAVPHRLIDCPQNWSTRVHWLHVPLQTVLGWRLPDPALTSLLHGVPLVSGHLDYPGPAEFERWSKDLANGFEDVALLEIQAGVRRLLHAAQPVPDQPQADGALRKVIAMARFIAMHAAEPIGAADVADAAHLHPNYAMTLFRKAVGVTMHTYLVQRRVAEAQRLLVATEMTIGQIAMAAGFGSQSGFYDIFVRSCGKPPGVYRRANRTGVAAAHPEGKARRP